MRGLQGLQHQRAQPDAQGKKPVHDRLGVIAGDQCPDALATSHQFLAAAPITHSTCPWM